MADSYILVERFNGISTIVAGEVSIGKNDVDTVKYANCLANMAEGTILSVPQEGGSDYKNLSGFNTVAVLMVQCANTGVASRHVKIYFSPTTNSSSGATLLWEIGSVDNIFFDASTDSITTSPLTIQNNHFIIVENVDDSRAGLNDISVIGADTNFAVHSLVVERGA